MMEMGSRIWHIEDQIRPSPGRKIQLELNLKTNESIIKLPILKKGMIGLQVYGVNLSRNLIFREKGNILEIDLGDLNSWTSTANSQGMKLIQLKINFIYRNPYYEISSWDLGYKSNLKITGYQLNDFYLSLPKGLDLKSKGKGIDGKLILKTKDKSEILDLSPQNSFIDELNKKKIYHFSPQQSIKKDLDNEKKESEFHFSYSVVNEKKFFIISIMGVALLTLALSRFIGLFLGLESIKFDIRYFAASVAFFGLLLGLIREGYEIPLRKIVFLSVLFLAIELGLELILLV
jgi:hypothetical protein